MNDFANVSVVADASVETNAFVIIANIFNGISEGGKIIIALILLLGLALFFFGRVAARKLTMLLDASIEAAKEARAAKTEAAAAKIGINNNHKTNVRDDIDGNHAELVALVKALASTVDNVRDDVGGIRSEIREDRRRVNALAERVNTHLDRPNGV